VCFIKGHFVVISFEIMMHWLISAIKKEVGESHVPHFLFHTARPALQMTEHALSAVCNIAAGSQAIKQQIAAAGLIPPLLKFLTDSYDRSLAQLAALAVRNLSREPRCRQEIMRLNGVPVLLKFLSEGIEVLQYPMSCEVRYNGFPSTTAKLTCRWRMSFKANKAL
jgi:hypothetical protein